MDNYNISFQNGNKKIRLAMSSNRTTKWNREPAVALQCKLNGKLIAALFLIPCSSLIGGYSQIYPIRPKSLLNIWNNLLTA